MGFVQLFLPAFLVGYVVWIVARAYFNARDAWEEDSKTNPR